MRLLLNSLLIFFLIACESQKEEDVRISLNYEHKQTQPRYRSGARPVLTASHHINVRDVLEKYIYDSTVLNDSMTGTVLVPIDVNLEVEYKNYTFDYPKIHYESGVSDPFTVSFNSPPTRTVTISVDINPDYPVEEVETVDNETIETTVTTILSWSDNFTKSVSPSQIQIQTYKDFWDNASSQTWDNISIGNPDNMTSCTNSTFINDYIRNKDNSSFEVYGLYCDGMYWTIGKCGWGLEISAFDRQRRDCACLNSNDIGYTIRPLIGNRNWGGVGKSCGAESQTLKIILSK